MDFLYNIETDGINFNQIVLYLDVVMCRATVKKELKKILRNNKKVGKGN